MYRIRGAPLGRLCWEVLNPFFGVFISLGLWLEWNLRSTLSTMASPCVFAFSDETMIPFGGLKAKETAQSNFGQKVLRLEEFWSGGLLITWKSFNL